jgi:hypothetical protein
MGTGGQNALERGWESMMSASRSPGAFLGLSTDVEHNGSADAYDALADLFLGESRPGSPAGAPAGSDPRPHPGKAAVELLLLGHLPVIGSAWAMQYARQASSDAGGPVAMLRLRGGEISLELIGGPAREGEPIPSLQAAIDAVAPLVRRWIVRVDDMAEPVALKLPEVDVVTLLSGADEAAVVSAYQTIKEMPAGRGLEVKLAIMGAAPEKAIASSDRISRTAGAHLGRKITVAACISRIGGGRTALYHRGPLIGDEVAMLSGVLRQIRSPRAAQAGAQSAAAVQRSATLAMPGVVEPKPLPRAGAGPGAQPAVLAEEVAAEDFACAVGSPAGRLGLEVLPFRCPMALEVELAVDRSGRLHVVGTADERLTAVVAMQAAAIWAKQNADVLRLASGTCGKPLLSEQSPVLHLVTPNARWVRPVLDGEIRLHALGSVGIGGRRGWCVVDLN